MVLLKPEAIIVFVVSRASCFFRVVIEVKYLTAERNWGANDVCREFSVTNFLRLFLRPKREGLLN